MIGWLATTAQVSAVTVTAGVEDEDEDEGALPRHAGSRLAVNATMTTVDQGRKRVRSMGKDSLTT